MYKLWNRNRSDLSSHQSPHPVEVIVYNANYHREGKVIICNSDADLLPSRWKSPLDIYYATSGTMGFEVQ